MKNHFILIIYFFVVNISLSCQKPSLSTDSAAYIRLLAEKAHINDCHPVPDFTKDQYIVGYGSLLEKASRLSTVPNAGPAIPVEVNGFRRGWFDFQSIASLTTTFLGAVPEPGKKFNAIIFQITAPDFAALDIREFSYCRLGIAKADLMMLTANPLPDGEYWIYADQADQISLPSSLQPIVESYVDIFITGCFEQEDDFGLKDFAKRCLQTSTNWSFSWVNDRIYPRRAFIYQHNADRIDTLLKTELPEFYKSIRIE